MTKKPGIEGVRTYRFLKRTNPGTSESTLKKVAKATAEFSRGKKKAGRRPSLLSPRKTSTLAQNAKSTIYSPSSGNKSRKRKSGTVNRADNQVPLPILQRRLIRLSAIVQSRTSEYGKAHTSSKFVGGTDLKKTPSPKRPNRPGKKATPNSLK
jgi:hypothetical protein